jgi:hypothetical protein
VADQWRPVPLQITLDGLLVESETRCTWAGAPVLVISTTIPQTPLAISLHSQYVGHRGVQTVGTHLTLGPVGYAPTIKTVEHAYADLNPQGGARFCVYEHAHILEEELKAAGHTVSIDVPDNAFLELERLAA